jgi:opacity protein-like surface antigen
MQNLSSLITAAVILLLALAFAAWVIKRRFIDKKNIGGGSQFVGRHIMMQFQDADKKKATEQVIVQEEERKQYFAGNDKDPESKPERE